MNVNEWIAAGGGGGRCGSEGVDTRAPEVDRAPLAGGRPARSWLVFLFLVFAVRSDYRGQWILSATRRRRGELRKWQYRSAGEPVQEKVEMCWCSHAG